MTASTTALRPAPTGSGVMRSNRPVSYVGVDGQQIWHEVSGEGAPVVLLHGAFAGASSWFAQVPALVAAGYRVYAPERRGHAHTADVDGPLTYAVMAEDTIAYLDQVVGTAAHLVGWSDGAVVAVLVAMQRPDLVDRMVLIGQYYNSSGRAESEIIKTLLANREGAMSFLRAGYDPISPDGPEHFEMVFDKTLAMIEREPEIDLADLASIAAPTLVLQGDDDEVSLEHSAAVAAVLNAGRLAVLPGSHALPIESPDVVNPLLVSFLTGGPPSADWARTR
jgi:pimeloyl-ACP methyl ester carboxylesterase